MGVIIISVFPTATSPLQLTLYADALLACGQQPSLARHVHAMLHPGVASPLPSPSCDVLVFVSAFSMT